MRAVVCKSFGGIDELRLEEVARPSPGAGEVLIRVHAAGVNFADSLLVAGTYQVKPDFPFSPGLEVAGEVAELGDGVRGFEPGDRVLAMIGHGGYAEAVAAAADRVIAIPASMDYASAAAFPVAYGTSHVGLGHRVRLAPGETLLVHGAAGGVGLTAVEIGKVMGATVIAAARGAEKLEVAARYGADHLIDSGHEDVRQRVLDITAGRGADVIFDPVGGDAFDASLRCVNFEGRILVIGFASGRVPQIPANRLLIKNVSAVGFYWGAYLERDPAVIRDSFAELFAWYEAGKLRPHVSHRFDLAEARQALELLLARKSTGKVVLTMGAG